MKKALHCISIGLCILMSLASHSQKQAYNWYFGENAGLDFSTTPPTVLTNGALVTYEGVASISDANGNLLFYTDGVTVYNKNHAVMSNGNGLSGDLSTTQSALVVQQPANPSLYYIFTLAKEGGSAGLSYSIVDMSLSSGTGSITVKNTLLYNLSCEKLCATRHCNGVDVWIVSHDWNSNKFRAYLLSASGVSGSAVLSAVGTSISGNVLTTLGQMKISPNGKKLGMAIHGSPYETFELYDFNASTGAVSNFLSLGTGYSPYGCEFSPDGTKFYGSEFIGGQLDQWDICAGSNSAILSSKFIIPLGSSLLLPGSMQVGPDGKIYVALRGEQYLGVINDPNVGGTLCNYVDQGQTIAPMTCSLGLPGFISNYGKQLPTPFSFTVNPAISCKTASFAASPNTSTLVANCSASSYSYTGTSWNFGDPASGAANTGTGSNVTHSYPGAGTYAPKLIYTSACGADTVIQMISLSGATLSVSGKTTICKGEKTMLTASGATSYTWTNSVMTPTVILSPTLTTSYTVSGTNTTTGCDAKKTVSITVIPCTWLQETEASVSLSIYPNPFLNVLTVEAVEKKNYFLYNYLGAQVAKGVLQEGANELQLEDLPAGVYFLNVETRTVRVVKSE